jgi:hypothetical protein
VEENASVVEEAEGSVERDEGGVWGVAGDDDGSVEGFDGGGIFADAEEVDGWREWKWKVVVGCMVVVTVVVISEVAPFFVGKTMKNSWCDQHASSHFLGVPITYYRMCTSKY